MENLWFGAVADDIENAPCFGETEQVVVDSCHIGGSCVDEDGSLVECQCKVVCVVGGGYNKKCSAEELLVS